MGDKSERFQGYGLSGITCQPTALGPRLIGLAAGATSMGNIISLPLLVPSCGAHQLFLIGGGGGGGYQGYEISKKGI
jgi:hypothetical protein